ncbi:MAG: hydrogenase iron-sulfur subunit [Candidatus Riflebacteria bacterium]|nr:hydrogenase iron-sulfur subunit [Candidatus Riflebacteria bacterium]
MSNENNVRQFQSGSSSITAVQGTVSFETPEIITPENWEPAIIGFLCNWCSYAGSDLTGTSRTPYPPNIRIIKVPCSSRVSPTLILNALQTSADGVLVSGCHPGDCHYNTGNYFARRRFLVTRELLTFVGYHPDRVQFSWVSAAEGAKFAQVVKKVTDDIKKLGPLTRFRKVDLRS